MKHPNTGCFITVFALTYLANAQGEKAVKMKNSYGRQELNVTHVTGQNPNYY